MNKETFSNLKLLLCSGILILTLASLIGCAKKEQPTVTETEQPTAEADAEQAMAEAEQAITEAAQAIAEAKAEIPAAVAEAEQAVAEVKAELPAAIAEAEQAIAEVEAVVPTAVAEAEQAIAEAKQAIAEAVEEHPTEEHPTAEAGEEHPTEEHPTEEAEHPTEEHPAEEAEHPTEEHPAEKAEHPEHPTEEGEHSDEEAEHPDEESEQTQVQPQREVGLADISDGIKKHIAELSSQSTDGMFHADYDGADLALTLEKVHDEKLAILGSGAYFACTDLKATDGSIYDLDFFLTGEAGNMKVTETTVHKDNGTPLYGWKQRDDGVWIKSPLQ